MSSKNKVIEALRSRGYRATPQRITIANTVLSSKKHPSAETIYEKVKQVYPTLSMSTVYNTLHLLRDLDLVNELAFHDNIRYDPNTEIHLNLVCKKCQKITDLVDLELEEYIKRVTKKKEFTVTDHRLDIYGLCKECMNKQE
jgi:Fur family peroxide stress response transcriptional regulator